MAASAEKQNYSKSTTIGKLYSGGTTASIKIKTKGRPKKTILPVIYVPGVFASRIKKSTGESLWDPDDIDSMKEAYLNGLFKSVIGVDVSWSEKELDDKTEHMHDEGTVLDTHHDKIIKSALSRIKQGKPFRRLLELKKIDPWLVEDSFEDEDPDENDLNTIDSLAKEEYARRQSRGWYEILNEYADMMEHIYMLEDKDFLFPTYGFGYDWRHTLHDAAELFVKRIDKVLSQQDYPEFGIKDQDYLIDPAQKVIIVTHSMGSIMSRYASEVLGASSKIHSIIHLNQPTTGAPVLYRRFVTGTSPEKRFPFSISAIGDNVFNEILGNNSYHFTRMAGPLAGAVQLLPTNDYVCDETPDKHWLQVTDTKLNAIAGNIKNKNIYDLYKSNTLGLISCKRYDKNGIPKPYTKEEYKRVSFTDIFGDEVDDYVANVKADDLKNASDIKYYYEDNSPYMKDNYRLKPEKSGNLVDNLDSGETYSDIIENIKLANTFHTKLCLKHHVNTYVVRSTGKKTITNAQLNLDSDNILNCKYNISLNKAGDGTVPLTSQEALIKGKGGQAEPAGKIVTTNMPSVEIADVIGINDITHAKMPGNRHGISQTLSKILKVIMTVKPVKTNIA